MSTSAAAELALDKSDQERICRYSYLINRRNQLQASMAVATRERDNQKDAQDDLEEIELLGELPHVSVKVGHAFLHVPVAIAQSHCKRLLEKADRESSDCKSELERSEKEMQVLKNILHSKFGNAIRLD